MTRKKTEVTKRKPGRPKGSKNQITVLRENTELALRKYLESPRRAALAQQALDRVFDVAANSADDKAAIAAAKIVLDKMIPNVKQPVEVEKSTDRRPIAIQIVTGAQPGVTGNPITVISGDDDDDGDDQSY